VSSAVGIVSVLVVILVVYSLFFGRQMFSGEGRESTRFGLRYVQRGGLWRGMVEGLVLLFAVATIVGGTSDLLAAIFIGVLVASIAALAGLVSGPGSFVIQTGYSVVGLVASAKLLTALFEDHGTCSGVHSTLRTGVVVALIVVWVLSVFVGVLGSRLASVFINRFASRWHPSSGLALFGALDVVVLAAGPVGLGVGQTGVNVIFWGVAVIGLLTGITPGVVLLTCALTLAVFSVVAAYTSIPLTCEGVGSYVPMAMILGYVASAALISRMALSVVRRRF